MFMYTPKLPYFEYYQGMDTTTIQKFEKYIEENMAVLFTYAEKAQVNIKVNDIDARSMLNGKYKHVYTAISNTFSLINTKTSKKRYEHQAKILTLIVSESNNLRQLSQKLEEYLKGLSYGQFEWNKVFYGQYIEQVKGVNL